MSKQLYVGIDVSKGYADFVILDSSGSEVTKSFELYDTFEGHQTLLEILKQLLEEEQAEVIYAGVESTGAYENNWLHTLKSFASQLPMQAARINPLGVKNSHKADLNRTTTDKVSAKSIAKYMIKYPEKISYNEVEYNKTVKNFLTNVRLHIKQNIQLLNQLEINTYIAFPELLPYCKDGFSEWALTLLRNYPTAKRLSHGHRSKISDISYITPKKADELKAKAKESVASADDELMEDLISNLSQEILDKKSQIKKEKKKIKEYIDLPELELLETIPGIADWTALGMLIEIGTVYRFPTVKQMASFFGLHPVMKQSGDYKGQIRMSKQGSKLARSLLYNSCLSATRHNPVIAKTYHKSREKGMGHKKAMGACMHKMLRIIYGVLKNKKAFDANADKRNQKKQIQPKQSKDEKASERYQTIGKAAPMSGKQNRKRKAGNQHHKEDVLNRGVKTPAKHKNIKQKKE